MSAKPQEKPASDWGFRNADEMIASAIALRPLLRRNAPLGEAQRTPTDEVIGALNEIGIWNLVTPRRWGGHGFSGTSLSRIDRELAKGDPSVAWVVQILNGTTWIATLASDALQDELFGGKLRPIISSSYIPPGIAVPAPGGYRVNGKWPYSSGCRQANWSQMGVTLKLDDGTAKPGNFVYIPMRDLTIEDSWYSVGLQGTGSDTLVARDVFVPAHRFVALEKSFGTVEPGKKHYGEPSDYWPVLPFIRSCGLGQFVGMAEAMLELALENAKTKNVPTTIYTRQADSSAVQHDLAEAAAKIDAARMIVESSTRLLDEAALARRSLDVFERAKSKGQGSLAIKLLEEAASQIMYVAGSSAFLLANDIQRFWRDLNTGARHIINIPRVGFEIYGRSLLDVKPNIIPGDAF